MRDKHDKEPDDLERNPETGFASLIAGAREWRFGCVWSNVEGLL
jgi:hypothetical protein